MFYLRYFTSTPNLPDDQKRIWLYHKSQGKSRNTRILNVAHENQLYDILAEALTALAALPPKKTMPRRLCAETITGVQDAVMGMQIVR